MGKREAMELEEFGKIVEPCGAFELFYPDSQDDDRLKVFVGHLMKKRWYVSDEFRNYDTLWQMVFHMFYGKQLNLIYSIGDFQGILGFLDIIPQHKCSVMLKLWDKDAWKKTTVRDGMRLIDRLFDRFQLLRMETSSPDPRIIKIAEMVGFSEEGKKVKGFKWDGKVFDITTLSRIKEA
jgi:RimJ/RimL family protein N-acetyltransferase